MKRSDLFNDIRQLEFNNVSVSANALCLVFDWLLDHVLDALGNICFEALNASTECKMSDQFLASDEKYITPYNFFYHSFLVSYEALRLDVSY